MEYLQLALPILLILWLALWPLRGRARLIHVAMTIAIVSGMILLVPWRWPSAYAPLALLAFLILTILIGRRRPPHRHGGSLWPAIFAALATLAAAIGTAGLITARLPPSTPLDLAPPFGTTIAVSEGGARAVINRHRAVLDANAPSLSGWVGTAHGTTLHAVDPWGKPLTAAQPVLAPCAGRVTATGTDGRLGAYVMLACDGHHIVLSGLASLATLAAAGPVTTGAPLGTATSLTLHAQTPGTSVHPFSGDPRWITLHGRFPVRGLVIRP
jgi:hypothetical protein